MHRIALGLALIASAALADSIPKERPRARPASALTEIAHWEKGNELLKKLNVPYAKILTPEEEMATFKLAPGYRIELVAAEPMVQKPIFFEFDPQGRLWCLEYQGYMRDLAGSNEGDPICRFVVLEDTDHDGKMDKQTVYLDKLVMPRSFAFVKGGVLLQEPPKLWFCEDTDGDLKCDKRTEVGTMGVPGNPQHTANGLRYGIDNWLHCSDWAKDYQWKDGKLIERDTIHRGQFGQTFDETGRFFSCYENKALHADLIPAELLVNKPLPRDLLSQVVNVSVCGNAQEVFPIRVTPAVTLGALELRDDGRLRTYTIVSGICCYDGYQFPDDARGNMFIPESGGHLIGRLKLKDGIVPEASRFYPPEQEFIASTDERFRPVNARVGPDGALYVADMYHGIIEHVIFMVPWLTEQIKARGLDQGQDLGRLWRIVSTEKPLSREPVNLDAMKSDELVKLLDHPNGWHRLTAQRLLIERGDAAVVKAFKPATALGKLQHLWTSDALASASISMIQAALVDTDPRVRTAACQLSEGRIATESLLQVAMSDVNEQVRLAAALSHGHASLSVMEQLGILGANPLAPFEVVAVSSLAGHELETIELCLRRWTVGLPPIVGSGNSSPKWPLSNERTEHLIVVLLRAVLERGDTSELISLVKQAESSNLIARAIATHARKPIQLQQEPAFVMKLMRSTDAKNRDLGFRLASVLTWPGAKGTSAFVSAEAEATLSPAQLKQLDDGQRIYQQVCAACHQPHGMGAANLAPPLAGSDWVAGPPERIARVVLHGLYGPVQVSGNTFNLVMPGIGMSGVLNDDQIAAALSYVRRAWGNNASLVDASLITKVREDTKGRTLPWTADELLNVKSDTKIIAIKADAKGDFILPASQATTFGQKLAYRPALDVLAPWRIANDVAEWHVDVASEDDYEVTVTLAADDASAGDKFALEAESSRTIGTVISSGDYEHFVEASAGSIHLKAGVNRLLLKAEGPLKQELADVRAVRLKRAR
ncbi:MAG: c-type cytochrome [Verrucomicrobiaceae bacterium]|nr:c-type cytochrome [Verrucomicrobiaceae bacterium]